MNTLKKILLMSVFAFALSTPCFAENFNGEVVDVNSISGTVTVNVRDNNGGLIGQKTFRSGSTLLPNLKAGDQITGDAANVNGQWELNSVGSPAGRENVNTGTTSGGSANVLVTNNRQTGTVGAAGNAGTGTSVTFDNQGRVTGLEPSTIGTGTRSTSSGTVGSPSLSGTNTGLSATNSGTGTTGPTTAGGAGTNTSTMNTSGGIGAGTPASSNAAGAQ